MSEERKYTYYCENVLKEHSGHNYASIPSIGTLGEHNWPTVKNLPPNWWQVWKTSKWPELGILVLPHKTTVQLLCRVLATSPCMDHCLRGKSQGSLRRALKQRLKSGQPCARPHVGWRKKLHFSEGSGQGLWRGQLEEGELRVKPAYGILLPHVTLRTSSAPPHTTPSCFPSWSHHHSSPRSVGAPRSHMYQTWESTANSPKLEQYFPKTIKKNPKTTLNQILWSKRSFGLLENACKNHISRSETTIDVPQFTDWAGRLPLCRRAHFHSLLLTMDFISELTLCSLIRGQTPDTYAPTRNSAGGKELSINFVQVF